MASQATQEQFAYLLEAGEAERVKFRHGGQEHTVTALVERPAPQPLQHGAVFPVVVTLMVDADPAVGVPAPAKIDGGADAVEVAKRRGGQAEWLGIGRIGDEGSDPDIVVLHLT